MSEKRHAPFEPLKITARLQCGVVSDWTLPIDGVLYYQQMRATYGPQDYTTPGDGSAEIRTNISHLPLKIIDYGTPGWYYAASFAIWEGTVAEGVDHWNKRFDLNLADIVDFEGRRPRVLTGEGRYKSYHMPVYYRHALAVHWYVRGRRPDIARLLSMVTHLGKKVDQGWGRVLAWRIEPAPVDLSVRDFAGRPTRAIPCAPEDPGAVLTGFRPSYWHPRNQAPCLMPPSA